ncbi:MAG: M43 family zinc metalloprotease [Bacteroidota bacterium]
MKKIIFSLFCLFSIHAFAQSDLQCGTDRAMKTLFESRPGIKLKLDQHERVRSGIHNSLNSSASYTIPIVFHILHLGGPENISDSQVIDAVRILNRDYAKQNPDTTEIIPAFQSFADSTQIQFELATVDPNGNCTNGIVHYYDTDADWYDISPTLYSHTWDPTMYLNVYVVRTITLSSGFGASGYTYFPGSFAPGDSHDAIVVLNNYFGSIGTGADFQARVLTHEVGHWLNLLHVFGYNNAAFDCTGDDYVFDTPTTPGYLSCPNPNDPPSYQLCTPGIDENFQNYMDYSYCCRMFTQEQGLRMRDALNDNIAGRDNLWSSSNLLATGVTNPSAACIPIADFNFDRSVTCVNVPVTFSDASWNGLPTAYNWSFPSGSPATSTSANPAVTYSAPGTYSVTYISSNAAGSSSPVTKTNIITVMNNTATYQNVWFDGFEGNPLPNTDWSLANSSGGANWEQSFDAAFTGSYSAKITSTNNTRNNVTTMISPSVNLSNISAPELSFELAATELNPVHINKLEVFVSSDCEQMWTQIYAKSGSALITTLDSVVPFIPFFQSQWRLETISLTAFAAASSARFKFVYTRDTISGPSNIYIDDVNISASNGIAGTNTTNTFNIFPNPTNGVATLSLYMPARSNVKVRVTDMLGRNCAELPDQILNSGTTRLIIGQTEKLSKGVYTVHLNLGGQSFSQKLVVR